MSWPEVFFHFQFNRPPTDTLSAALRFIFLTPTPREIWAFLDPAIYWTSVAEGYEFPVAIGSRPAPPTVSNATVRQQLELLSSYVPENAGRAGGKVHLKVSDFKPSFLTNAGTFMLGVLHDAVLSRSLNTNLESSTIVALLLLDQMGPGGKLASELLSSNPFWVTFDTPAFVSFTKWLHVGGRLTGTLPTLGQSGRVLDARYLYGLDVLVGRTSQLPFDPVEEIRMRVSDPSIRRLPVISSDGLFSWSSEDAYTRWLRDAIVETLSSMLNDSIEAETFSDWYARRMTWAASGGAPGATLNWDAGDGEISKERMNKRGALLIIPESHYRQILANTVDPVLWSVAATKYDLGKMRAIWNTAVEEYVIEAYLFDQFDSGLRGDGWNSAGNSLSERIRADLARLEATDTQGCLMWDYADFNINHTFPAMQLLYKLTKEQIAKRLVRSNATNSHGPQSSYADVGYVKTTVHDLAACATWLVNARTNTYLDDHESEVVARVVRSLQSGQRSTSFTNTVLNRAYSIMVARWLRQYAGLDCFGALAFHLGDDVFLTCRDMFAAQVICQAYNLLGFAGQVYKVMADYRGQGEFLRINYCTEGGSRSAAGYPIRSVVGLISGEFFRDSAIDPAERAAAYLDQFTKVQRRGATLRPAIGEFLAYRASVLYYTDTRGVKQRVTVPIPLLLTPRRLGGYGLSTFKHTSSTAPQLLTALADSAFDSQPHFLTPRSDKAPILVFSIPSGEGKTFLADHAPGFVTDSDTIIARAQNRKAIEDALARARLSGCWERAHKLVADATSRYFRTHPSPPGVLLTWGREYYPSDWPEDEALLLDKPTNLRANDANRMAIIQSHRYVRYFQDFRSRNAFIFSSLSQAHLTLLGDIKGVFELYPLVAQTFSGKAFPTLKPPKAPTQLFFGRAPRRQFRQATSLRDFAIAHKLGATRVIPRIQEEVLASVLPGAYRASDVSNSFAAHALKLQTEILPTKKESSKHVFRLDGFDTHHALSYFGKVITALFRTSRVVPKSFTTTLAPDQPLAVYTKHDYGILGTAAALFGFSIASAFNQVVGAQEPTVFPGHAGRINTLLSSGKSAAARDLCAKFTRYCLSARGDPLLLSYWVAYLEGGADFYPPPPTGQGNTFTSFTRAIVLRYIQLHYHHNSYVEHRLQDTVYVLELLVADLFACLSMLHYGFPVRLAD
ncbi:RNA-dependent RNA polymerase [Rosellinia necatrix fusagravirus 3]|uniref:RNA-directed RNA polymerase n=1 Tax=Rosellinia necatrix fusagravirus 3 TaxID=2056544 RepID=A0A2Z5WAE8_9VIRU|nr:RNA-dependent RNA polymerase [Rosellinia necatrix fusagravirus 3]